ncbi:thiol reductase thioredoxin [Streptococcus chenjunshii]|uniref:Thiol reductase thioredoxin n=1 Tax=Streptococcus chenjunshii TaxID=2173853 RepID=A0A372KK00_9STRE|nr:thioredoxin domain-containing protein [Streptococcus chenjunshii]AXQ79526.1 thiol reductase thioredoxin [Streptococcus chenjunshii]RFU50102.1 thiol reductase thioredoxin [Streptococcus chenjunshii]RFU52254.1 thiol reductase thioredoxin [Streptococcus chenjunshii]
MSTFTESIQHFTEITAAAAQEQISSGAKFILFVGRETCPFCRRFAPKLAQAALAANAEVSFLNSEDAADAQAIQAFRQQYEIPTVPGLLVAEQGQVKVICDSSLSEEAIAEFIG